MIDYHIHTNISPDAQQALGDVVKRARELGITHLAITDHHEVMESDYYEKWKIEDAVSYGKEIDKYNNMYDDIYIAKGIEIGHINRRKDQIKKILDTINFDFVISSAHFIDGYDPYFPSYFEGRTKQETYYDYLNEIRNSIDEMDERTCVIGHIGYAARYSPYTDYELRYEDFTEIFDDILLKVIKRGFGIELNTSNFGRERESLMPPFSVVKRYKQLGGEIITIGSDAHFLSDIGKEYNKAKEIAINAGFKYVSVFKNLKREMIAL